MRTCTLVCLMLCRPTSAGSGTVGGEPAKDETGDRIARLVRGLGHERYAQREQASRELAAVGEPARAALTKAETAPDPEVGRRARQLLDELDARALAAAAKK